MGWQDAPLVGESTPAWASAPVVGEAPKAKKKPKTTGAGAFFRGASDTGTFGFLDELGAAVDTVAGSTQGTKTVWDGKTSFKDAFKHNLQTNREILKQDEAEHGGARIAGQLTGALAIPTPAAAVKTIPRLLATGAAGGAAYGLGSGESTEERLNNVLPGAAVGLAGAGAAVAIPKVIKGVKGLRGNSIAKEVSKNPYAAYDAEVAEDLSQAISGVKAPKDPKARAEITAKTINSVEQGYSSTYRQLIDALDLPKSDKLNLKEIVQLKQSLSPAEVAERLAKSGAPPEAKAALEKMVIKTRRLRELTPETARGGLVKAASTVLDVAGPIAGTVAGGPVGGAAGYGLAKGANRVLKAFLPDAGEAARVNSAERLISKLPRYKKIAELAGPSGQREADAAFRTLAGKLTDTPKVKAAPVAAAIDAYVSKGIKGTGSTLERYAANQLGVPAVDAERALKQLAQENPELAQKALRLANNHNPLDRKFGIAANPRLKQILTDDGTFERLKAAAGTKVDGGLDAEVLQGVRKGNETPLQVDISSPEIRNPDAYRATAQGNQNRVSQTLTAIQNHAALPEPSKALLAEAATSIGNTSKKTDAEEIVKAAIEAMPVDQKELAETFLKPLLAQIKK